MIVFSIFWLNDFLYMIFKNVVKFLACVMYSMKVAKTAHTSRVRGVACEVKCVWSNQCLKGLKKKRKNVIGLEDLIRFVRVWGNSAVFLEFRLHRVIGLNGDISWFQMRKSCRILRNLQQIVNRQTRNCKIRFTCWCWLIPNVRSIGRYKLNLQGFSLSNSHNLF